jgi:hypothetical protein
VLDRREPSFILGFAIIVRAIFRVGLVFVFDGFVTLRWVRDHVFDGFVTIRHL